MMLPQANKWKQPKLFELEDGTVIYGKVYQMQNGRWRANISGGWWTATGRTKKEAIARVKKAYERESSKV